jgi:hypothetical protein
MVILLALFTDLYQKEPLTGNTDFSKATGSSRDHHGLIRFVELLT